MKKLGYILLAIAIAAGVYYYTLGSTQLTTQIKTQLKTELATLKTQGFSLQEHTTTQKKDHFIISFDDPKKIANFLSSKGIALTQEEVQQLKGLSLGVDVSYMENMYSSISADIYPLTLPTIITSNVSDDNKNMLAQIEKLLKNKTILMHIYLNKLGTSFKGYFKDIDEVLKDDEPINIAMKAFTFSGDLKNDKLQSIEQTLQHFSVLFGDSLAMNLDNLESHYTLRGKTVYDSSTDYHIDTFSFSKDNVKIFSLNQFSSRFSSSVKNNLVDTLFKTKIDNIQINDGRKNPTLKTLVFDMNAKNLDLKSLKKLEKTLEKIDENNLDEVMPILQELISKGISLEVSDFSVQNVSLDNQEIDGFTLSSNIILDKDLNINALKNNPMLAMNAVDANLNLALSSGLFSLVAELPQAVMLMMFVQPKDVNGKKVYNVELKDGSLSVNDKSIM